MKKLIEKITTGRTQESISLILSAHRNSGSEFLNETDNEGWTLLHWASAKGNIEIINTLIASGTDINIEDKFGHTPMYMAAWHDRVGAVKTLLEHGADFSRTKEDYPDIYETAKSNIESESLKKSAKTNKEVDTNAIGL